MSFSSLLTEAKATLRLAGPIMVAQVSQMAMGFIDTLMIGQLGAVPLAASAMVNSLFTFVFILGIGLFQPLSVLIARAAGRGEPAECAAYLRQALGLAVAFGALGMLVLLGLGWHLDKLGQPTEVTAAAGVYLVYFATSVPFVFLFQVLRQYAEALHRPWAPMVFMVVALLLNVLLNYLWIYGHAGFPAWGLEGAGAATWVVRLLGTLGLAWWLARTRRGDPTWPGYRAFRWEVAKLREMLRLGFPAAGQLLFEGGAFTAAAVMMGWLGTVALAAHQIALSCASMTFMFVLGLAMAVSIRVGQAVGAGEHERVRLIGWSGWALCLGGMSLFAAGLFFGARPLAMLFVSEAAVVELAAHLLVVAAFFQIFDGGQVVGSAMLRGLTDVRVPTLITFVAYWGLALPGGYFWGVRGGGGAEAVWWSLAAGLAWAASCFAWRFRRLTRVVSSPVRPAASS